MKSEVVLEWINSAGGSLLLLEESLLKHWRGFDFFETNNPITDYDRACEINEYVGTISIDSGFGLVLGGEPFQTTWLSFPETKNGLLICWVYAEDEIAIIDSLSNLQNLIWEKTGVKIQFLNDELVLFDSANDGNDINIERLEIKINEGLYEVETSHYKLK